MLGNFGALPDAVVSGGFDTTRISRSAWFDGSADYLSAAFSANQNQTAWTLSCWFRLNAYGATQYLWSTTNDATRVYLSIQTGNTFLFQYGGATNVTWAETLMDQVWYHVRVVWDTDNGTAADRLRLYLNGTRLTPTGSLPGSAATSGMLTSGKTLYFGSLHATTQSHLQLAQCALLSGDVSTACGESITVGTNGAVWAPVADSTIVAACNSGGNEGFVLSSAIGDGTDDSTHANTFTPTSMSDALNGTADSPSDPALRMNSRTTNYDSTLGTLSKGGKVMTGTDTTYRAAALCALPVTGKWYAEAKIIPSGGQYKFGIRRCGEAWDNTAGHQANDAVLFDNGAGVRGTQNNNVNANSYTAGANDIVQVCYDADTNEVWFGVNDTWLGAGSPEPDTNTNPTYTLAAGQYVLVLGTGSNGSGQVEIMDQDEWAYTVPTDAKCPRMSQRPAPAAQGADSQQIVLWTGDGVAIGSGGQAITGVGGQPDLVIAKGRSAASNWRWVDVLGGAGVSMYTDLNNAEFAEAEGLSSFDSDGFTVGNSGGFNTSSATYAALAMILNGSGASNNDGNITTTVSVAAGGHASLVKWTGNATATATIGHGLGADPDLVIIKNRDQALAWVVVSQYIMGTQASDYLYLHDSITEGGAGGFGTGDFITYPSADTIRLHYTAGAHINGNTHDMMAMCFKNTPGLCFVGAYTGNGSTPNGPYIPMGFKPRWLFVKSLGSAHEWCVYDTARGPLNNEASPYLHFDVTNTESTVDKAIDILADGIKIVDTTANLNTSGGEYLVLALADVAPGVNLPPIPGR